MPMVLGNLISGWQKASVNRFDTSGSNRNRRSFVVNPEYEAYEKACAEIRETNDEYLDGFEVWLMNKGLSQKTIDKHISNVDFYINEFLCRYDAQDVTHGCVSIDTFLGDWFIRKAPSSCTGIKDNAAGIKKFYEYLLERNIVMLDDYVYLCATIRDEMPSWLSTMRRYERSLYEDDDYYNFDKEDANIDIF